MWSDLVQGITKEAEAGEALFEWTLPNKDNYI